MENELKNLEDLGAIFVNKEGQRWILNRDFICVLFEEDSLKAQDILRRLMKLSLESIEQGDDSYLMQANLELILKIKKDPAAWVAEYLHAEFLSSRQ